MGLIEVNRNPSRNELNWFGLLFGVFFGLIGTLVYFKAGAPRIAFALWSVAGVVVIVYYLAPPLRRPLYVGWMYAVMPIGWVVTHVIMAVVYYLVLTPIGLLRRLFGRDPLTRRFESETSTYWSKHCPGREPSRYFRQF